MINEIIESLLYSFAISFDSLVAFFGYGVSKINVPFKRTVIITFLNCLVLAIAILIGYLFTGILSENTTKYISFSILLFVGVLKLSIELFKIFLTQQSKKNQSMIRIFNFNLFFKVCLDPVLADINLDKKLSLKESLLIGLILSIDSFGAGLGIGLNEYYPYLVIIFSFVIGILFSCLGNFLGK